MTRDWAVSVQQAIWHAKIISSRSGRMVLLHIPDVFHTQWHHMLKLYQSPFHPENRSIPSGHVESLRTFHCIKVVVLSKQTKRSFGWAKCFPMLANMDFWDANLSSDQNRTQIPACSELWDIQSFAKSYWYELCLFCSQSRAMKSKVGVHAAEMQKCFWWVKSSEWSSIQLVTLWLSPGPAPFTDSKRISL